MQGGPHLILILSAVSITFSSAQTDLCGTSEIQCHLDAFCSDTEGSYVCTCSRGFLGDGKECELKGWAVRSSFAVEAASTAFRVDVPAIALRYTAALMTGSFLSTSKGILSAAQSTAVVSHFDAYTNTTIVVMNGIFDTESAALHARSTLLKGLRFEDFLSFISTDLLGAKAVVVVKPQVHEWGDAPSTSRLGVETIQFRENCGAQGCWIVDLKVTENQAVTTRPFSVLYFPLETGDIHASFSVENFPCRDDITVEPGTDEFKMQSTVCCIPEFKNKYNPVHELISWMVAEGLDTGCSDFAPTSAKLSVLDDMLSGPIEGMPSSFVTHRGWYDLLGNVRGLRLQLDVVELGSASIKTTLGAQERMKFFVGLADLTPTGTTALLPTTRQYTLLFDTADAFAVSSHGDDLHDMVQVVNASFHQVKDPSGGVAKPAQYISIRMKLASGVVPHSTEELVKVTDVRVGLGNDKTAVDWQSVCGPLSHQESVHYLDMVLDQDCAPDVTMCTVLEVSVQNSDGSTETQYEVNLPLESGFVVPHPKAQGMALFLEIPLTAADSRDRPTSTAIDLSIPVADEDVVSHCWSNVLANDLESLSFVDIYVGDAQAEMPELQLLEPEWTVLSESEPEWEVNMDAVADDAQLLEDGLITLVVRGRDSAWQEAENYRSNMELLDLVSVHVMRVGGKSHFQAIVDHIATGQGFSVDSIEFPKKLVPSGPLSDLCGAGDELPSSDDLFPYLCYIQRELDPTVLAGFPASAALELGTGDWSATADFSAAFDEEGADRLPESAWQTIASGRAEELRLNGRYNRAWWVNPGYAWKPAPAEGQGTLSLSPAVIMVGLVKYDDNDHTSGSLPILSCVQDGDRSKCQKLLWSEAQTTTHSHARETCVVEGGHLGWISDSEEASRLLAMCPRSSCAQELWVEYDDSRTGDTHMYTLFELEESFLAAGLLDLPGPEQTEWNETSCAMLMPITARLDTQLTCSSSELPFFCSYPDADSTNATGRPNCFQASAGGELTCFAHYEEAMTYENAALSCQTRHTQGQLAMVDLETEDAYRALLSAAASLSTGTSGWWVAQFQPPAAPQDTWTSTGSYTKFGGPRMEWTAVWRGARPGGDAAKAVACAIIGTTQRWQVLGTRCGGSRGFVCSFGWDVSQDTSFDRDAVELYTGRRRDRARPALSKRRAAGEPQYAVVGGAVKFDVDGEAMVAELAGQGGDKTSRWTIGLEVDREVACTGPASEFRKQMRTLVLEYLQDTAGQEVYDMQVSAYRVVSGCERRATAVDVEIDTVVVVEDPTQSLATTAFLNKPEILAIRDSDEAPPTKPAENPQNNDWYIPTDTTEKKDEGGGGPGIALIAGAAAGGVVCVLGLAFAAYRFEVCGGSKSQSVVVTTTGGCNAVTGYVISPAGRKSTRASAMLSRGSVEDLVDELPPSLQEAIEKPSGSGISALQRNSLLAGERHGSQGNRDSLVSSLGAFSGGHNIDAERKSGLVAELSERTIQHLIRDDDAAPGR